MTHISSIGAGLYSDLSVCRDPSFAVPATPSAANWATFFATEIAYSAANTATVGEFTRILNVREFPQMGVPPNIVNVPTFGSKTSRQVQGQADAPTFEVTLNYVPELWQKATNQLGVMVGDGNLYGFRFALLNADSLGGTAATKYATVAAGLGTVANSLYYWAGKLEALQINPQLTDANTAVLTISIQSDFYGAFTIDP